MQLASIKECHALLLPEACGLLRDSPCAGISSMVCRFADIQRPEVVMSNLEKVLVHSERWERSSGYPAALGLLGLGMTLLLFTLNQAGVLPLNNSSLATGLFYGGMGQLLVGMMEYHRKNAFGAVAFTAFGFFWFSLIALFVSPVIGWSGAPHSVALSSYLIMWGLFTGLLFMGTLRQSRLVRFLFALLSMFLLAKAAAVMTGRPIVALTAHSLGFCCGSLLVLLAGALGINELFGRSIVPIGRRSA